MRGYVRYNLAHTLKHYDTKQKGVAKCFNNKQDIQTENELLLHANPIKVNKTPAKLKCILITIERINIYSIYAIETIRNDYGACTEMSYVNQNNTGQNQSKS